VKNSTEEDRWSKTRKFGFLSDDYSISLEDFDQPDSKHCQECGERLDSLDYREMGLCSSCGKKTEK